MPNSASHQLATISYYITSSHIFS